MPGEIPQPPWTRYNFSPGEISPVIDIRYDRGVGDAAVEVNRGSQGDPTERESWQFGGWIGEGGPPTFWYRPVVEVPREYPGDGTKLWRLGLGGIGRLRYYE